MWRGLLRERRRVLLIGLLASRIFSCIPEDELQCEDAAQRLESCCGRAAVRRCVYERTSYPTGGGCSGSPLAHHKVYEAPDLKGRHAVCLAQANCEELRAAGACRVSAWLLPPRCTIREERWPGGLECHRTCVSLPQEGACDGVRPADACKALEVLRRR